MNKILEEDLKEISNSDFINWQELDNRTIFITGATGLIGSNLVNSILYANHKLGINCRIIALVRNIEKAKKIFKEQKNENLSFVIGDVSKPINLPDDIDYIIHAASQTSSKGFVESPIETINTVLEGTKNTLNLAAEKQVKKFLFLSTMEVYGRPETDERIDETHATNLLTNEVRNCYPISKRMAENLTFCYGTKKGFGTNVLRLTQTFGPGVNYDDGRVFADFARSVIENKDIILHTKGETKRCYLYTSDAIAAILKILIEGKESEIYNVANPNTYCSIFEMANTAANLNARTNVRIEMEDISKFGYAPTLCMNLDTTKLEELGWTPKHNLTDCFARLINYMKIEKNKDIEIEK